MTVMSLPKLMIKAIDKKNKAFSGKAKRTVVVIVLFIGSEFNSTFDFVSLVFMIGPFLVGRHK